MKEPILSREELGAMWKRAIEAHGVPHENFAAALESAILEKLCGEPVAVISSGWQICYVGSGPIAPIVERHELKIGDKLYALNRSKA